MFFNRFLATRGGSTYPLAQLAPVSPTGGVSYQKWKLDLMVSRDGQSSSSWASSSWETGNIVSQLSVADVMAFFKRGSIFSS